MPLSPNLGHSSKSNSVTYFLNNYVPLTILARVVARQQQESLRTQNNFDPDILEKNPQGRAFPKARCPHTSKSMHIQKK
jgi:hypothetical protein